MANRKKIILFLVEGSTDEQSLALPLEALYQDHLRLNMRITDGDITSRRGVTQQNAVKTVGNIIKNYAQQYKLRKEDFYQIIHIMDTDGFAVPDTKVQEDLSQMHPCYRENGILTCRPDKIRDRNHQKQMIISKLLSTHLIWGCSYQICYMSCNLEHVLHNCANVPDEEKNKLAKRFEKQYSSQNYEFIRFFQLAYPVNIPKEWSVSWSFISQGMNSLMRYSNLCLAFPQDG